MTNTGSIRLKYSLIEVAPSRFVDVAAYEAWCVRADEWARREGVDR